MGTAQPAQRRANYNLIVRGMFIERDLTTHNKGLVVVT